MESSEQPKQPEQPPTEAPTERRWRQAALGLAARWSGSLVYGAAVTLGLTLYLAYVKPGAPGGYVLRLLGMVARTFTPWFMIGYSVARSVLPDVRRVTREESLLLPAVEGALAVVCTSALLWLVDIRDPYLDTAWVVVSLVGSVTLARLWVRRVFRY